MAILFRFLDIKKEKYPFKAFQSIVKIILSEEKKKLGEIIFIFIGNEKIFEINRNYLNHYYYTDVITFSNCKGILIAGDIFISLDQVRINAIEYKVDFENELLRVIIHGVLHLLGYNDQTDYERREMRDKEDHYICKSMDV